MHIYINTKSSLLFSNLTFLSLLNVFYLFYLILSPGCLSAYDDKLARKNGSTQDQERALHCIYVVEDTCSSRGTMKFPSIKERRYGGNELYHRPAWFHLNDAVVGLVVC